LLSKSSDDIVDYDIVNDRMLRSADYDIVNDRMLRSADYDIVDVHVLRSDSLYTVHELRDSHVQHDQFIDDHRVFSKIKDLN